MTTTHVVGREPDSGAGGAILTVTVSDDATMFSGLANVHRYDQPSAHDIVSYVRSVLGEDPQWASVHLIADTEMLRQLIQAFGDYDVELTCEDLSSGDEMTGARDATLDKGASTHPVTSEWEEIGRIPVRRPTAEPKRTGSFERFGVSGYVLVGVVGLVAALCAAAIWFVTGRNGGDSPEEAETTPPEQSAFQVAPSPLSPAAPEPADPEPEQPAPENVTLEHNGLSVELPVGFHLEPDGDMWRATGPDPDFRLQLAVDPLYGIAPDAVMQQVVRDIEADPELHLTDSGDAGVRYSHDLPDGSHAEWSTWTDRDVQISIGCHTRDQPTTVQSATCAMANDSARFTPPE